MPRVSPPIRPQESRARVCPSHDRRGVFFNRSCVRAADLRSGLATSTRGRPRHLVRAGIGGHLLQTSDCFLVAPNHDEVDRGRFQLAETADQFTDIAQDHRTRRPLPPRRQCSHRLRNRRRTLRVVGRSVGARRLGNTVLSGGLVVGYVDDDDGVKPLFVAGVDQPGCLNSAEET